MCGFVGVINFDKGLNSNFPIKQATNCLIDRGPDSEGFFSNEFCSMGFRRLSIIDLSKNADQPMITSDGRYVCVFNGEIYNFKEIFSKIKDKFNWKSKSDTEVLLNSFLYWGDQFINQLDGMFAFLILDTKLKKIFAGRDRVGEKPFYYYYDKKRNNFFFSSKIKPLMIMANENFSYNGYNIGYFLNFGHFKNDASIFNKILKIPPGNILKLEDKTVLLKEYFSIHGEFGNKHDFSFQNFDALLKESIQKRLISDKPVGIFLSGGIDSSLISFIASKVLKNDIKTFTVGFEEKKYNESIIAKKLANEIGSEHHEIIINEKVLMKNIPDFFSKIDEPIFDPSTIPLLILSRFAKKNIDVCLSGDGADELFGGYQYYSIMRNFSLFIKLPKQIKRLIISSLSRFKNHKLILLSEYLKTDNFLKSYLFLRTVKKDSEDVYDLNNSFESDFLSPIDKLRETDLNDIMKKDIKNILAENYLRKTDYATMSNSLESRAPFLSKDIIQFSQNLHFKNKVSFIEKKIFLRKYAKNLLPKYIINKKKQGFEIPIKEWIRGGLNKWCYERIFDRESYKDLPINQNLVQKIFNIHNSGKRDFHPYLWTIICLLEYNRNFKSRL